MTGHFLLTMALYEVLHLAEFYHNTFEHVNALEIIRDNSSH